ncbi:MAG: ADOP family duplicated permease [Thermoanaerobaculia bacterium]|nr:ADOP family duplicated permease [Thermoanaerobaculia bacterium]
MTGRRRFEDDMAAEMEDHLERRIADLMDREGIGREEAARRARLEFGSVESTKAACRDARRLDLLDELRRNLGHSVRILTRSPGLSLAITLTLGLGVGANVAVFTLVDAALLRPLPYPEPERLVVVERHLRADDGTESVARYQTGRTWQTLSGQVEGFDVAALSNSASGANAVAGGVAKYLDQQRVSAGFFRVVGVDPLLGRGFSEAEDVPGGPAVAVLSHGLWLHVFGGESDVLGRTLQLRGEPYEVVGVMPAGFRTGVEADLWTPLRPTTTGEGSGSNYLLIGRLQAGATWSAVEAQVEALGSARLDEQQRSRVRWEIEELQRSSGRGIRDYLFVSWAAAWLVLWVSCINVAGLLLAHAGRRAREIATRMALGGSRGAILRQLLTESLVLSLTGTAAGIGIGIGGVRWLSDLVSVRLGLWQPVQVDGRVLVLCAGLAILAVLVGGLLPAWQATRVELRAGQGSPSRGVLGSSASRTRRLLLVTQIAVVVALLVGAGLLARTVYFLQSQEPGFEPDDVMTATVSLLDVRYEDPQRAARLFSDVAERLLTQPEIKAAGAGLSVPYQRPLNMPFRFPGDPEPRITNLTYFSPGYFEALEMHLLQGRLPDLRDGAGSAFVAVVNRDFVRTYLRDREVLGSTIRFEDVEYRIVGVVADTQQRPGWGGAEPLGSRAAVYVPVSQVSGEFLAVVHRWFRPSWVLKTTAGPSVAEQVGRALAAVDPELPLADVRTMREIRDQALASQRVQAGLVCMGGALALVLAAMGLAGLIAASVTERSRELGLRMALGATTRATFRSAVWPGLRLAVLGLAIGLPLSIALVRGLRTFLHGVSVFDPATYVAVAVLLLLVATVASAVPASRVLHLDPSRVLRQE